MGWGGRWERGERGTHVNPWLIHVNVCQKPLQYCKVINLQLIKINGKKNKGKDIYWEIGTFEKVVTLVSMSCCLAKCKQ